MKSFIVLAIAFILVNFNTSFKKADNYKALRNPIGTLDPKNRVYTCSVYPKEAILVEMFYSSRNLQTTVITENNNRVAVLYSPGPGNYTRKNNTASVIIYKIKNSATSSPQKNLVRMEIEKENFATVGWEDGDDADFNDAVAQITIIKPLQQRPSVPSKKKKN